MSGPLELKGFDFDWLSNVLLSANLIAVKAKEPTSLYRLATESNEERGRTLKLNRLCVRFPVDVHEVDNGVMKSFIGNVLVNCADAHENKVYIKTIKYQDRGGLRCVHITGSFNVDKLKRDFSFEDNLESAYSKGVVLTVEKTPHI